MREKCKRKKANKLAKKYMRMNKSKENILIYLHMYIYTPTDIKTYTNTDTHILINTLCVIQVRYCFLAKILGYSNYALINPFTGR